MIAEQPGIAERDADVTDEGGDVVEPESLVLQDKTVKQRHHHPHSPIGIQLGRHAACPLAIAERVRDALAHALEARLGLLSYPLVS